MTNPESAGKPAEHLEARAEKISGKIADTRANVREHASAGKEAVVEFKGVLEKIKAEKVLRDEFTAQVRQLKDKREAADLELRGLQDKIRASIDQLKRNGPAGGNLGAIKRELDDLEWRQQTENLRPEQERELSRDIKELRKMLKAREVLSPVQKELDAARAQFNEKLAIVKGFTAEIQKNAAMSQEHHEALVSLSKRANALRKAIKSSFDAADTERQKIDGLDDELEGIEGELDSRDEDSNPRASAEDIARERAEQEARHAEKKKELHGKAKELYDKFKAGASLSLEDLQVLQAAGLL